MSHRLVLPQVPRVLLADRSAGRALALQNETPRAGSTPIALLSSASCCSDLVRTALSDEPTQQGKPQTRTVLADRSAGRAFRVVAMQNHHRSASRSSHRNLHPPIFRRTGKGQPAGSSTFSAHDDDDDELLEERELWTGWRRHRLTAARAQQRPPWAP